ncbi:MAG: PadR family transcriptional regulator [Oscillospiraceae bacterium]|nr:PadR family transcriptional regulator [Oscillospiraceae bacterium]
MKQEKQENFQGSFRRGLMPLVILSLLKNEDMYGYQLVQETERRSGGAIVTQEGSLYPVLYKLLDGGFISDRRVLVGKRMTRVYYHLEATGKAYLEELTRSYHAITDGMFLLMEDGARRKQAKTGTN